MTLQLCIDTEAHMIAKQTGWDAQRALQILSTIPAPVGDREWRKNTADEIIMQCAVNSSRPQPYMSAIGVRINGKLIAMPMLRGGLRYTDTAAEAFKAGE